MGLPSRATWLYCWMAVCASSAFLNSTSAVPSDLPLHHQGTQSSADPGCLFPNGMHRVPASCMR